MKTSDFIKLNYRRQYIISPKSIKCPFDFKLWNLNSTYQLYSQVDLCVTSVMHDAVSLFLLGDIFDYEPDNKSNKEILNELIKYDFPLLIEKTEKYTGRYALIYISGSVFKIIPDNTSSRKVYYTISNGELWVSSQPYLLGEILDYPETTIPSKKSFYDSQAFIELDGANIGDTTIYDSVHQLLPNHYLDLTKGETIRYFPLGPLPVFDINEIEKKCAIILKGYLNNIICRYDVMLPVTAGKDSRLLLAATKEHKDKIFYYINKTSNLTDKSQDIEIPNSLFTKLKLNFHNINPYLDVDEDFKHIYFANNKRSSSKYLPIIFNYYKNYENLVNLPGNIAFETFYVRRFPGLQPSPEALAKISKLEKFPFATEYYSSWLNKGKGYFDNSRINVLNMFYWEERIANWGTQIQTYKDIAQEEFNPYNSKLLTKLLLSIDYRLLIPPKYSFHKSVINLLWPEVLHEQINPKKKDFFKRLLERFGLLKPVYRLKSIVIPLLLKKTT